MKMRMLLSLLLLATILGASASPAAAQLTKGRTFVGVYGGADFPIDQISKYTQSSWVAGASVEYLSSPMLAWGLKGSYNDFRTKDDEFEKLYNTQDLLASYDIFELSLQARMFFDFTEDASRSLPYARGGLGYYWKNMDVSGGTGSELVNDSESTGSMGWFLGVGYQVAVGEKNALDFAITINSLFDQENINGIDIAHSNYWVFEVGFLFGLGPDPAPAPAAKSAAQ